MTLSRPGWRSGLPGQIGDLALCYSGLRAQTPMTGANALDLVVASLGVQPIRESVDVDFGRVDARRRERRHHAPHNFPRTFPLAHVPHK